MGDILFTVQNLAGLQENGQDDTLATIARVYPKISDNLTIMDMTLDQLQGSNVVDS